MTGFEIRDGVPMPPRRTGGRPIRSDRKHAIIETAARKINMSANAGANEYHAAYFGSAAKEGEQRQSQIRYLARLIRNRRRDLFPLQ
jgi:hypothetical protein